MSHNLNETNHQTSMMYVGDAPWHQLGTKLDKPATAFEAIRAAQLDFMVEKFPLKTIRHDLPVEDEGGALVGPPQAEGRRS